jgi:hypothetical protein
MGWQDTREGLLAQQHPIVGRRFCRRPLDQRVVRAFVTTDTGRTAEPPLDERTVMDAGIALVRSVKLPRFRVPTSAPFSSKACRVTPRKASVEVAVTCNVLLTVE